MLCYHYNNKTFFKIKWFLYLFWESEVWFLESTSKDFYKFVNSRVILFLSSKKLLFSSVFNLIFFSFLKLFSEVGITDCFHILNKKIKLFFIPSTTSIRLNIVAISRSETSSTFPHIFIKSSESLFVLYLFYPVYFSSTITAILLFRELIFIT